MGHAARLATIGVVVALAGTARADDDAPPPPPAVDVRAGLEAGLHAPRSLTLDVWLAINERLRLGVTTSHAARRQLGAGRGLCLSRCDDRLPAIPPDDDAYRFAGLAAEAQILFAPGITGRAAIDTTRFAPTAAGLELGLDLAHPIGPFALVASPVLRIGLARRDLDGNRDTGALTLEVDHRTWPGGGLSAFARGEVALEALRSTPSFGAAFGAWHQLCAYHLAIRAGTAEVVRAGARSTLFAEIAVAWVR